VNFGAAGLSYQSVAAWLQNVSMLKEFKDLWVPTATKGSSVGGQTVVTFSSTASMTNQAKSQRQANLNGGSQP
jgi:hypothetical protein